MSSGTSHISFTQVVDLVEGRLSPAAQAQAQAHTAGCARCAAQFTWLSRVIALMRTDTADDAPTQVVARAVDSSENDARLIRLVYDSAGWRRCALTAGAQRRSVCAAARDPSGSCYSTLKGSTLMYELADWVRCGRLPARYSAAINQARLRSMARVARCRTNSMS